MELPSLLPSFPGRGHQEYLEEAEEGEADEETRLQRAQQPSMAHGIAEGMLLLCSVST